MRKLAVSVLVAGMISVTGCSSVPLESTSHGTFETTQNGIEWGAGETYTVQKIDQGIYFAGQSPKDLFISFLPRHIADGSSPKVGSKVFIQRPADKNDKTHLRVTMR